MNVLVLGAGAWGTALAVRLAGYHPVVLWGRRVVWLEEVAQVRVNTRFLPGVALPDALVICTDFHRAVASADLVMVATPFSGLRPMLSALKPYAAEKKGIVWLCKGVEAQTGCLGHQIATQVLGEGPFGVISGPSFAQEVAAGLPVALTVASRLPELLELVIAACHKGSMRLYRSTDLVGVELGGALKNVIAIAVGLSDGLQLGTNAQAALITRGAAEMARLGVAMGAQQATFMGLSGVGDLVLTCMGQLSRNRRVGYQLGCGLELSEILANLGHVAEGVSCAPQAVALADRFGVEMPIVSAVSRVLSGALSVHEAAEHLLSRQAKEERP